MLATLLFYAICATPFLMLIVIGFAIAGTVRRGEYRRNMLGTERPQSPQPAVAVARVVGPMVAIVLGGAAHLGISPAALGAVTLVIVIVAGLVYRAAAQRRLANPKD